MKRPTKKTFNARGDRCPICKNWFRDPDDCPHSVGDAVRRIEQDYIHAVARYEVEKALQREARRLVDG